MNIGIDPELALKIVRHEKNPIAYDTETTGLTGKDVVCGYVITNADHSLYIPVRHSGGGNILAPGEFERELAAAFAERSRQGYLTVGHNLPFDLRMGAKHGVVPGAPLEDTQINEGLVDDNTIGYSLDDCAERHKVTHKKGTDLYLELGRQFGGAPDRKQMQHFSKLPGDNPYVIEYACGDGISTLELRAKQIEIITKEESTEAHALECSLIPYVHKSHIRGIKVDAELAGRIMIDVDEQVKAASEVFPKGFNVNSPKDVEGAYRQNGYQDKDFQRTEMGKVSFTQKWLEGNEIGRAIVSVRQFRKLNESFCEPLVNTYNLDGRIHAVLNQSRSDEYGTNTGRFSCSEPNLQAFPKRNKNVGKIVRRLLIPDEGMEMAEADFVQQEPRLFAHFTEDHNLLSGFLANPPVDFHTNTSQLLNRDRESAKRLGMGMLTGLGPRTLAGHMGYSEKEAQKDWGEFMAIYPGIRKFQDHAKKVMLTRGWVRSILGRRFRMTDKKFAYKATSRIIQGNGADHMKLGFLLAHQYAESLPEGELDILMTIHDSTLFQYKQGRGDIMTEVSRLLESAANKLELNVPIPTEIGVGTNWAEASYGK